MRITTKRLLGGAVSLALMTCAAGAFAGYRYVGPPVYVSSSYAEGAIGDARASADTHEYIGCATIAPTGGSVYGWCAATDPTGHFVSCSWSTAEQAAAVATVTPQSWIYFTVNTNGTCGEIAVENLSYYQPAAP